MKEHEAVDIFKEQMSYDALTGEWIGPSPHGLVVALSRLGIIKLDQPKTATDRALASINAFVGISNGFKNGAELISCLDRAGVRIVEK